MRGHIPHADHLKFESERCAVVKNARYAAHATPSFLFNLPHIFTLLFKMHLFVQNNNGHILTLHTKLNDLPNALWIKLLYGLTMRRLFLT